MMHLKFTFRMGANGHPQKVMKELGITYIHATPQSMMDQWWFWGCENIPSELPIFLSPLNIDPMDCMGFGLRLDSANKIRAAMEKSNQ